MIRSAVFASAVAQHFTLQQNFEKSCEYAKVVFTCFVDLKNIRPGSL